VLSSAISRVTSTTARKRITSEQEVQNRVITRSSVRDSGFGILGHLACIRPGSPCGRRRVSESTSQPSHGGYLIPYAVLVLWPAGYAFYVSAAFKSGNHVHMDGLYEHNYPWKKSD